MAKPLRIVNKCGRIIERILSRGEPLQNSNETNTADENAKNKSSENRRKRINRLKKVIVIVAVFLLILPTVLCIILGLQVNQLQKQMKELAELHGEYGLTYDDSDNAKHVLAAEIPVEQANESNLDPNQLNTKVEQDVPKNSETESADASSNKDAATESTDQRIETTKEDGVFKGKKVYLTFDDGPSLYTNEILDILAKYNVKATFFVIGKTDDESKEIYKRIVNEGHTLGMHSYSHQYDKIYNSLEDFTKDFTKLRKLLYDTTGYKPTIYRFPGGSDNLVNKHGMNTFIRYLNEKSIVYYDWNVVNGDATGVEYTKKQLIKNVLDGVETKKTSIVLMHDSPTKKATLDSLPTLLEDLIDKGAEVLPLNNEVPPIQMIKADSVK
jgi:peptidoglycan/xylan/chitin deacetylase (PgdA/CDA1 family)